jgi:putative FmdB family regulatory protein
MPVYEYRCGECGEQFELFLRSAVQKTAPTCPKCGSTDVKKALSLFGVGGASASNKTSTASCGPTAST